MDQKQKKELKKLKSMGLKIIKAIKIKNEFRYKKIIKNMIMLILFYLIHQVWKNLLNFQKI